MINLLLILLAYVGLSYLWIMYVQPSYPKFKDTWYDKALRYPMDLLGKLISKS